MWYRVSFINSADVIGATFPGNESAQIIFSPNLLAAFLSTPPGLDDKSKIVHSGFTYFSLSSSNI